jgi:hypothetical protein
MWSPLVAIRAGVADRSHNDFQGRQTGLRRLARKRVPPSFLAGVVPRIRFRLVFTVAVLAAFGNRMVFDQYPQRPAFKGLVRGTGGRVLGLDVGFMVTLESVESVCYTTPVNLTVRQ